MSKSKLLLLALSIACISLYVYFILLPLSKGYEYFTEFAANLINKKQRLLAIRDALPIHRFVSIRCIVYIAAIILCFLFGLAYINAHLLDKYVRRIVQRTAVSWLSFFAAIQAVEMKAKLIFVLTVIYLVVRSLWYMNHLPFIHDEAYTISNFVIPGPAASMAFYPYPNNHILFSLFSYPFSFLPLRPEISFRLPALIAVVLSCFVLFRLLLIFFEGKIAAFGVAMFAFMLPVMVYSILARGYSLLFLFCSLSILSLIRIIVDRSKYHRALLMIFSVMGLYTIPSYVYPFAAILCVYFGYGITSKKKGVIKNAIFSGVICAVCTLVLYVPPIITSGGWNNFIKIIYEAYDASFPITEIGSFLNSVYAFQFFEKNLLIIAFLFLILIGAFLFINKIKNRQVPLIDSTFYWTCFLGVIIPLISFIVQKKMVAPRTHSYVSVFFVGFTLITLNHCISMRWRYTAFVSVTIFIITMNLLFAHKSRHLKEEVYTDNTANMFASEMLKGMRGYDTCYTFDLFYLAQIQLRYALAKRPLTVFQQQPGSPSTAAFNLANKYNWIITNKNDIKVNADTLNKNYRPVSDREDATLWKRR